MKSGTTPGCAVRWSARAATEGDISDVSVYLWALDALITAFKSSTDLEEV